VRCIAGSRWNHEKKSDERKSKDKKCKAATGRTGSFLGHQVKTPKCKENPKTNKRATKAEQALQMMVGGGVER